jgi:hypothetical protein
MQLLHNRSYDIALLRITSIATLSILIVSILLPLRSSASTDIVDLSDNDCVRSGSSQVRSDIKHYDTGIVSVSGAYGDWGKNSCLRNEVSHFNRIALYVSTNYPSSGCHTAPSRTNAFNCGYNLGLFDVNYASSQGVHSNTWYMDVENNSGITWTSHSLNQSFLWGLSSGLKARGVTVRGFYSTSQAWQSITGGWNIGLYAWYATGANGHPSSSDANRACKSNFTGGPVVYYQYIVGGLISGIDYDAPC